MHLLALIIPFLSFMLQSYPRLFNKYFGVDVWTRLLEIEHVKKSGHKIPGRISKGFIIEGNFDYPIFFPWIFSFLPKKNLLAIQGFVSPFFDAVQNILVFYISLYITDNILISLTAQAVYSSIPMLAIENSYLTPRSLGYLMFTLSFFSQLLFFLSGNALWLISSLLFTCLLFLSHRFALQSLLLISIFFSIYDRSFTYLIIFVCSFVIVTLLSNGFYLRVAKGHLSNIYFWIINYKYRFSHQIYGIGNKNKKDWVTIIYSLLSQFSPIFLLSTNIWIVSVFIYFYLYYFDQSIVRNILLLKMSLWVMFFYILAVIVLRFKILIPIGEGQRYLEMASVPTAILTSVAFFHFLQKDFVTLILFIFLLLANIALIIFIQIKGIINDKNRSLTNDLLKAYAFINSLKGKPRIMCIPHQITTMTVYNTKNAEVLVNADNPGLLKISDFFPILTLSINEIAKKYNLDYLLIRKSFVEVKDLKLRKKPVVFSSNDVLIIKLK